MKIIYVTEQIYLHGGAEKILIQKLNYWVEKFGYDVTLITAQQKGKSPFFPVNKAVKHIDLNIDYVEGVSYFSTRNLQKLPTHYQKLKERISEIKPDAIFVLSQRIDRFFIPLAAKDFPTYFEYHTSFYGLQLGFENKSALNKFRRFFFNKMISISENFYTKIIYLNQEEYDHFKRNNAVIIPNFYNAVELVQRPKQNKVISLGRLSFQKGYDLLIDAWEIVAQSEPQWKLEIYGNGENRAALENQIVSKKLQESINLLPATDRVNELMAESAFYVMSSRFETFPMVLLEAMSNRLATVSFNCPTGPASMLTNGEDSILVKNGDIKELAKNILVLIRDVSVREQMGANAAENVKRFNAESIMEKWNRLIIAKSKTVKK